MNSHPDCGKQPYSSRAEAERALRLIQNRRRKRRSKKTTDIGFLRPYPCEDGCAAGVWHLTSSQSPRPPRTSSDDGPDPTDITILPRGRRNVPVASLITQEDNQ